MDKTKRGFLAYENKDTQERKYLMVEYDKVRGASLLDKIKRIHRGVYRRRLFPRVEDSPKKGVCKWCPFSRICFDEDFNGNMKWPKMVWEGKRVKLKKGKKCGKVK